ncbi:gliding motility-associated C-terminal domain-containing protein [Chitinophaga sp. YR573]|uniref:gliding motility-associated C-terminal domain-containing protein n=1 Tax=Chitinophaga sp. YR573 TaxID=1881040 RepID=UPI0008B8926C|nr:gliding motility-associated C-terminal domain-containing protein [Chitinophaga sp. YR573]SEW46871.1 gliding motility-associated C-terminal domain-containing protein [Chitinophaga sp. YR573]
MSLEIITGLLRNKISFYLFILFGTIISSGNADAQLCTGSLGDPIVNINFGTGTGRGTSLGSSVTAYSYSSSGELGEGYYTIANSTSGLKGSAWHVTTDHTGNANGYMMVINCATLASEGVFYTKTVSGLCPGTYEFSAWLMNIMNPSGGTDQYHPNITFRISTISGTVLGSYKTGEIAQTSSPSWKQYGFYFTTGTNTSVVITILNSAPSATPGNDVALDDITFSPCGPIVTASISGGGTTIDLCEGVSSSLTLISTTSAGYDNPSYQWQLSSDTGSTWTDISGANAQTYILQVSTTGTYLYRLSVANGSNISSTNCRIASNDITVTVHETPTAIASSNSPSCYNDTLKLYAKASDSNSTFSWTGPDSFTSTVQNPVINAITASDNGWYYVTITTAAGCVNTDSVAVETSNSPTVDAGADQYVCEGETVTLNGSGTGNSFSWSPGASLSDSTIASPVASVTGTTTYILSVRNAQCSSTDTVTVFTLPKPTADAGTDKYILEGGSTILDGQAGGTEVSYYWTPEYSISSSTILNPTVSPAADTTYTLHVSSPNGCGTAADEVKVTVYKNIKIPNAFSPNGDGINDTWSIKQISSYTDADVSIFNRYGQLVFHSKGYTNEWDGRYNGSQLPVGTYYYVIDLKTLLPLHFTGWVALLR